MDPTQLLAAVNNAVEYLDATFTDPEDAERFSVVEFYVTFQGHSVKLAFTTTDSSPADYRYNLSVYDADSGDLIATGNGGRNWEDALSIVHWNELVHYWD